MRTLSVGIGGVLLGIAVTLGAQGNWMADVDQAHEQFMSSTRQQNTAAWVNVVTDDVMVVLGDGRALDKTQRIAEIKNGEGIGGRASDGLKAIQNRKDYKVRLYDNTAIATWINPPNPQSNNVYVNGARYVRVFVRQGDSWRVAHTQETPIR
jgi:hypothetical protein